MSRHTPKKKTAKSEVIDNVFRFRCDPTLIERARVVADRRHCARSDIGREGFIRFLEAEEKRLGLSPTA